MRIDSYLTVTSLGALAALACAAPHAAAQSTSIVSRASDGAPGGEYCGGASLSGDGRLVVFHAGPGLVPNDTNGVMDAFVHDRSTGTTRRVSVATDGAQADGQTWDPRISADGRFVVFASPATNLVAGDTNAWEDVFRHDLLTGATVLVSVAAGGGPANHRSASPRTSADGRFVAFDSNASNLVLGDANGLVADVFVRDMELGTTALVSLSATGGQGNAWCQGAAISDDGRFVAFTAMASNLVPGDGNSADDVFVRDLLLGTTSLVSRTPAGAPGNGESGAAIVSGDGRYVAFTSSANDLVANDTNGAQDVFVYEIATGSMVRASLTPLGAQSTSGGFGPSISHDGGRVAFVAGDGNLDPEDRNGFVDVFLRDLVAGTTEIISLSTRDIRGTNFSTYPAISGDGRHVGFESPADNLIDLAAPASRNVFVRDTLGCTTAIAAFCAGGTTSHGCSSTITASGDPSGTTGSGFTITIGSIEGGKAGILFYGRTGPRATPFGGGSSLLCVLAPMQRTGVQPTGGTPGGCDGTLTLDWNHFVTTHPAAQGVPFLGGQTVWVQGWFRDPLAPGGSNLSAALWFDVCR
ncbi:MAG: calcium-binding protein [Planctomycetes bacterium]|nr:calcium-binding protein [Planctomycetota bacterium]